jgi:predicted tellurium resistance membrane protein TerC
MSTEIIIAFLTLTFLEVILGIDNIIFISIVTNKLPAAEQPRARLIGLSLAMVFRVLLLLGISWLIGFNQPLFTVMEMPFSGRDLILLAGGLFLLGKSTMEIHHKVEGIEDRPGIESGKKASLGSILFQIVLLDLVFSFDSILTAIGLTDNIPVMIAAVIVSIIIMMVFASRISNFINQHPSLQILALSFLMLIGFMLAIEAFEQHVPKGYIYFAVFFSMLVEVLNMRLRKKTEVKSGGTAK